MHISRIFLRTFLGGWDKHFNKNVCQILFSINYLADPRPTLNHCQRENPCPSMITIVTSNSTWGVNKTLIVWNQCTTLPKLVKSKWMHKNRMGIIYGKTIGITLLFKHFIINWGKKLTPPWNVSAEQRTRKNSLSN